jgi:chromosome partitioning protein
MDLDLRQCTSMRFFENRAPGLAGNSVTLPQPLQFRLSEDDVALAAGSEADQVAKFEQLSSPRARPPTSC